MKLTQFILLTISFAGSLIGLPMEVAGEEIVSQSEVDFQASEESLTKGALRIDGVSVIHFGSQPLKGDTIVAQAIYTTSEVNHQGQYVPLHIETTDDRGTNTGWSLQVKQSREFTEQALVPVTPKDLSVLTGAELTLSATEAYDESSVAESGKKKPSSLGQKVRLNADFQTMVEAKADEGIGSWGTYFGEIVEQATTIDKDSSLAKPRPLENPQITLKVPGQVAKKAAVNYQAELIWVLVATPEQSKTNQK